MEEQNTQTAHEAQSISNLTISDTAIIYLTETGKWTKLLSIIGFVFIGLIVIIGLFAGSMMSLISNGQMDNMPNGMGFLLGGMYLLIGLLYFFPTWYLMKFSQKLKLAIATKNNDELNTAFSNQKSFYKFWGILMIIMISIYILIGLFALAVFVLK